MTKERMKGLFERFKGGNFTVTFWDGETCRYGQGPPVVSFIFHKPLDTTFNLDKPLLSLGEAYMDGYWDFTGEFTEIIRIIEENKELLKPAGLTGKITGFIQSVTAKRQQKQNIEHHYDLGNDFFSLWLDETLSYSCAYFKNPDDTLYQAQINKIDHTLKKLQLKPGERLLDIGCGWGWLVIRAAQQYGVRALGITLSDQQYAAAGRRVKELGLAGQVEIRLASYQDLSEQEQQFDKIVSVGMFEHVGRDNLPRYMEQVNKLLVPGGLSLLHTITGMTEEPVNDWMEKYIFPGGYIPSLREIIWLLPLYRFHLLHAESLRLHYAKTLDHWYNNFSRCVAKVREKFDERFVRMWSLYLRGCAASFRVSGLDIYQLLFSKGLNNNLPMDYGFIYA
ncbi:SAM-dependent methyltransferase [Desulforamulus hydrothermalis]|uniref:Cyclopropane-fatty-acyl-phospholipid synthase n=1 Tax=Desulforamulus hydrothermalis Lam5 = DSM 18033 TaxID=1121428 RepID=K8EHP3_9FIRM|nr:cyclopropane-fatty-acyl-phospholipid synthase family protein [Desulforamulus hydrothermalis]CCO08156.1 Cyclopropane-fatty-acyl-phospholipid synthase [Desulforamulus hydrothermalis Lam5 = DSM 18033]SHH23577.1 cyclopropane-fatty-acyl-phospholipid synthase [Desulforamulus hydrothermalis Lam5 = DSM 18033]